MFTSIWSGITGVVTGVANWFSETFSFIANAFAGPWTWVSNLFTSIWDGMKGVVMGFVEWLSPVVDLIIAPFRAIGNTIGGIIGSVKGWFGETVALGETELATMNKNSIKDADPGLVQTTVPAPVAQTAAPLLTTTSAVAMPSVAASPVPMPGMEIASPISAAPLLTASTPAVTASAAPASSSGTSLAIEHIESAQRKGVSASAMSYTAASAFEHAGAYTPPATAGAIAPIMDMPVMTAAGNPFLESLPFMATTLPVDIPDIDTEARVIFAEAMSTQRQTLITNSCYAKAPLSPIL